MPDLHAVPTPLDARSVNLRDDVENVHAAAVAAVPVRDVPMRRDEPRRAATSSRTPFNVRIELDSEDVPHIDLTNVVSWFVDDHQRLDVYGRNDERDGNDQKRLSVAPGRWISIQRTTGTDAEVKA